MCSALRKVNEDALRGLGLFMLFGTGHTALFPSGTVARYLEGWGKLLPLTAFTTQVLQHSHFCYSICTCVLFLYFNEQHI